MSMAREIYQQIIVDHGRKPRNFAVMPPPCCVRHGQNPLCGDNLTLYVRSNDDIITDISFSGDGCAISMASASLLTELTKNMSYASIRILFDEFHAALVNGASFEPSTLAHERLSVLLGVAEYPARVKCATLAWQTLMAVVNAVPDAEKISTE